MENWLNIVHKFIISSLPKLNDTATDNHTKLKDCFIPIATIVAKATLAEIVRCRLNSEANLHLIRIFDISTKNANNVHVDQSFLRYVISNL